MARTVIHSFIMTAGVNKIGDKVDLLFTFDSNRARALYDYITGPVADRTLPDEVVVDTTLPQLQHAGQLQAAARRPAGWIAPRWI